MRTQIMSPLTTETRGLSPEIKGSCIIQDVKISQANKTKQAQDLLKDKEHTPKVMGTGRPGNRATAPNNKGTSGCI